MIYHTLMLLSRIVRCLPHSFLLTLGKGMGILYYRLIKKQRERAVRQMMDGLGISETEARETVRLSFINLGRNILEILYMPNLNKNNINDYISFENREYIESAVAEGKGVVVFTAHIGTWEWLSAAFLLTGIPATAIAKKQPNEQYTRVIDDLRATIGMEVFSRGTSELFAAARALKAGKLLGFLADQDAGPGGAFIDFLGRTASTPLGPAVFAKKFGSPVVPAFILRRPDGRHKVWLGKPMHFADSGDTDKDLYDMTVELTRILERVIRENPTQWLWFQHRWNTPPEQRQVKHHIVKSLKTSEEKQHGS
ncbi:MAG: lysophospholipid acyltransferase family protein [Schwartzia sp.]|nr:lysophospholipid acyltransferase family protein [Schwartzia sp. (in: firmicutes)]